MKTLLAASVALIIAGGAHEVQSAGTSAATLELSCATVKLERTVKNDSGVTNAPPIVASATWPYTAGGGHGNDELSLSIEPSTKTIPKGAQVVNLSCHHSAALGALH